MLSLDWCLLTIPTRTSPTRPPRPGMPHSHLIARAGIACAVIGTLACETTNAREAPARDSARGDVAVTAAPTQAIDWKAVDAAMGRAAVVQPGDIHRFNFPRSDMHV